MSHGPLQECSPFPPPRSCFSAMEKHLINNMGNIDCGYDSPLLSCKGIFCHGGDMNETYQSCDKKGEGIAA